MKRRALLLALLLVGCSGRDQYGVSIFHKKSFCGVSEPPHVDSVSSAPSPTPDPAPTPVPIPTPDPSLKEIAIVSEPMGARIEVNDDYVGNTPIVVRVPCSGDGFKRFTTIRALPTVDGQFTQQKIFLPIRRFGANETGSQIPSRILFQMNLQPISTVSPDINVNVN